MGIGLTVAFAASAAFSQDVVQIESPWPTEYPAEVLVPRDDGKGKFGYVREAEDLAEFEKMAAEMPDDVGVVREVEPPKKWHIPPKFDDARLFDEGVAPVKVGALWGFIDEGGRFVARPEYQEVSRFFGGYAPVRTADQWGYVNRQGKLVIPAQFEDADLFFEGLAPASKDGKYGYINTQGVFAIPPQFDYADVFSEGAAVVKRGSKRTYILKNGEPLTDLLFDRAKPFTHGRAAVLSKGRWGILDGRGQLIVPFQFEEISPQYSEGLAAAKLGGKWGYIDLRGGWVIPPSYDKANHFASGLAVAYRRDKEDVTMYVIDPLGNVKLKRTARDCPPEPTLDPSIEIVE